MLQRALITATIVLLLTHAPFLAAEETAVQKHRKELQEVEQKLAMLLREIPPDWDSIHELELVRRKGKLKTLDVQEVPGSARLPMDGAVSPLDLHHVDITATGSAEELHYLLSTVLLRPRLTGVQTAVLSAEAENTVRLQARLVLPVYIGDSLPSPDLSRGMEPALREQLRLQRLVYDSIVSWRDRIKANAGIGQALAELDESLHSERLTLSEVRIDDGVQLSGMLAGTAARKALDPALVAAGFAESVVQMAPVGFCRSFSVSARLKSPPTGRGIAFRDDLFDVQSPLRCKSAMQPLLGKFVARGEGPVTDEALLLRLRRVDLSDLFMVLSYVLGQNYVVDPDVRGRIDLDVFQSAGFAELNAALDSAGVVVRGNGLRRVSRKGSPPAAVGQAAAEAGQPVKMSFQDVDLRDLLCLFGQISRRPIRIAGEVKQTVNLFVIDLPEGEVLDGLIASAGLTSARQEETLIVGSATEIRRPDSGNVSDPCRQSPSPGRIGKLAKSAGEISVADVEVAAVVQYQEGGTAWIYGPSRQLLMLEKDQELLDGRVISISIKGVGVETTPGQIVTLALPQ